VISSSALTASCVSSFSEFCVFYVVRNRLLNGLSLLRLIDALILYDLSGADSSCSNACRLEIFFAECVRPRWSYRLYRAVRCIVRSADRRGSPGGPGFGQWSPGPPDLCDLRSAERRPLTTGHWPLFSRHSPLPGRHSLRATNRLAKIGFVCWIPHYFVISPDLETTNT